MFYPVHIHLQGQKCLVVGGGTVAERKIVAMLLSGGDVTLISPDATELLAFLARIGTIRWIQRQLKTGDTDGYFLVCAATDFTPINTAVFQEAYEQNGIRLVNVVDVIPQCTFAAASVVTDGEAMLSISTSGKSPMTSRRIREYFEELLNANSLYTLGYENGAPVRIENRGLPYPVYLLLENRTCLVLSEETTPELERRLSLLKGCGASIIYMTPDELNAKKQPPLEDVFLVLANRAGTAATLHQDKSGVLLESLDTSETGTHVTPDFIIDKHLIISMSVRPGGNSAKIEGLKKKIASQFANRGYGAFIDFLGSRRAEILKTFPTPKKRADFFETLVDSVGSANNLETKNPAHQTCCLGLKDPACTAECLFNWVHRGELDRANAFTTKRLAARNG